MGVESVQAEVAGARLPIYRVVSLIKTPTLSRFPALSRQSLLHPARLYILRILCVYLRPFCDISGTPRFNLLKEQLVTRLTEAIYHFTPPRPAKIFHF